MIKGYWSLWVWGSRLDLEGARYYQRHCDRKTLPLDPKPLTLIVAQIRTKTVSSGSLLKGLWDLVSRVISRLELGQPHLGDL